MGQIQLTDLTKRFGDTVAVDDLSLDIDDEEFLVLVGPSGCGKSTTLRMLAGLETPTSGDIYIGGDHMNYRVPQNRDIAMVFQDYALYPHMTVRQNIRFGLEEEEGYTSAERDERVVEVAETLGIADLLDRKPDELSGGQQQRVALGRAIVRDPDVFLMDEPLSNLDAKLRTQMRTEIQRIQEDLGVTTVYVTHDQTEAMTMADRIVILNDGKLQQVDPPERCYDEPNNEFVAGFIGSPSMNFFEVTATDDDGGVRFESPSFEFTLDVDVPSGEYTLGVRPEDFTPDCEGGYVETVVDVVEPVGSDNFLYLQTTHGSSEVVARVESELRPAVGDEITLGFDVDDMHLFGSDGARVAVSETRLTDSA